MEERNKTVVPDLDKELQKKETEYEFLLAFEEILKEKESINKQNI